MDKLEIKTHKKDVTELIYSLERLPIANNMESRQSFLYIKEKIADIVNI